MIVKEILPQQNIRVTLLIIDKQFVFTIEVKDDSNSLFEDAVGIAAYSNSKPRMFSYISIFENFFQQTEMSEILKARKKMQKDFINIAAHELGTPAQAIMGYTEIAMADPMYFEFDQKHGCFIETINRNAKRLYRLSQDILDVARIESHTFKLKKESLNLINLITDII